MKRHDPTITLFSFQDIITSVMGIMILIILVMALQLVTQRVAAEQEVTSPMNLEALREKVQELRRQLAELSATDPADPVRVEILKLNDAEIQAQLQELEQQNNDLKQTIANHREELARSQTADRISRAERLSRAEQELADIQRQIASTRAEIQRLRDTPLIFLRGWGGRRGAILIVQCDQHGYLAAPATAPDQGIRLKSSGRVKEWLDRDRDDSRHVIIAIKRGGVKQADTLREMLRIEGLTFGLEILADNENLVLAAK